MRQSLSKEMLRLTESMNSIAHRLKGEEMMLPLLREVAYAAHSVYQEQRRPFSHGPQLNAMDRLKRALEAAGFSCNEQEAATAGEDEG